MRAPNRRVLLVRLLGFAALPVLAQDAPPQVVKIIAQKFHYTPAEFRVKAGVPIVLEFTALDFVHGFNMPDLKVRADLTPGPPVIVKLPAAKAGVYEFVCDNFCGDKHEEMHGRMVVEA